MQQQELVPNIVTAAAALSVVPLAPSSPYAPPAPRLLFNITAQWPRGTSPLLATRDAFHRRANITRALAMMNPGYDVHGHPLALRPPLTLQPDLSLIDYLVRNLLFTFYLVDACVPRAAEHDFMQAMATSLGHMGAADRCVGLRRHLPRGRRHIRGEDQLRAATFHGAGARLQLLPPLPSRWPHRQPLLAPPISRFSQRPMP
jgi:hypothetical protein